MSYQVYPGLNYGPKQFAHDSKEWIMACDPTLKGGNGNDRYAPEDSSLRSVANQQRCFTKECDS